MELQKKNLQNKTDSAAIYETMVKNPLAPITLRIGVAGHRKLPEPELSRLRKEISVTYADIHQAVQEIAKDQTAQILYAQGENITPVIRIISSLAEGTDRLCIEPELIPFEPELACILPFLKEEFELDFLPGESVVDLQNGTVDDFNEILNRIGYGQPNMQIIELDGNRASRDEAYNNCSHLLVEHSDILIAVYDGGDSKDEGTATTVKAAKQNGIPVIHISTETNTPICFHCSTRFGKAPSAAGYTQELLEQELRRILLFTEVLDQDESDEKAKESRKQKILNRFKRYQDEENLQLITDHPDFDNTGPIELEQKDPDKSAKAFDVLKKTFAMPTQIRKELSFLKDKDADITATDMPEGIAHQLSSPSLNRYFAAYLRADRLANYYANIHRSIFVLIYLLGALALTAAVSALIVQKQWGDVGVIIFVLAELGLLITIFRLYRKDHQEQYHDRWLEYRCLAEFLRPMRYLSLLGRPHAISNFRDTEEYLSREMIGHSAVGRSWLYIYTETINRWSGFNACRLDVGHKRCVSEFIKSNWLNGQIDYHINNAATMRVLGKNLGRLSFTIFFATTLFVVGKLILLSMDMLNHSDIAHGFTAATFAWMATALPMLATTAYAIRNHAEFDISAQRSLTMRAALIFRRKKLKTEQTSQQMAATLNEIATVTIRETVDWLEIYEVKESELG
ncbi:MAG: hypothetical protein H6937_09220 [Burkholderiales bacterium]|nr:hypothetical protein [Burkholderiales bacterium]